MPYCTWLVTSRLETTRDVQPVESCRAVLFDKIDTAKIHDVERVESFRDVTWRAKRNLGYNEISGHLPTRYASFRRVTLSMLFHCVQFLSLCCDLQLSIFASPCIFSMLSFRFSSVCSAAANAEHMANVFLHSHVYGVLQFVAQLSWPCMLSSDATLRFVFFSNQFYFVLRFSPVVAFHVIVFCFIV